ncbi:MAG: M20/M25/M40 family metallo-hydrolase [Gammaproteobacteria bacterium]|nr:M20/M25/M40 family metallo-hydrolase [Gammaproteobacteria bacterium]NIM74950.1 M20/M25/M40 family metallo-hydrolase [Gammaproteobacteria bacterium]NIN39739.1 M20/M25/M40 family metallo-hydrolase [Gammaproteobacteria bacterium]NIO26867.1 M20/M25/M40 family metallo-hydrolase [Gammaproteobacteria bacterium]NIO67423.1 M20/M25/M40 family metallo-hydrolase [Gammaproteobacteria bacterium]
MDSAVAQRFVNELWDASIVPELMEYIRIPNKSPAFDADWQRHGHMEDAVSLIELWCRTHALADMHIEVVRLEGRTPLLFMEIPGHGSGDDEACVLLYGHLDKQPEMHGWRAGLGPWTPVMEGERLFGRGGADDGYAAFASLAAIRALAEQGLAHARCVILIEACEESGSYDLPFYIDALAERIGKPNLVICLDSGAGNYDQLWCTTSLRGLTSGDLSVEVLSEGVHSGDAGGIVPSSFRILRALLARLEDAASGRILPESFHVYIPEERRLQAAHAAEVLGPGLFERFPFLDGVGPVGGGGGEMVLERTWRPALEITGAAGLPALEDAGNVARPLTAVRVSLRLPPTCDAARASDELKKLLETDPPYGARVRFRAEMAGDGWNAPPTSAWLEASVNAASRAHFGRDAVYMGEGGTIPFMGMLGEKFPESQFLITGVLGPGSNAHGPNEFLDIPTGKKLTCCVAQVLHDHWVHAGKS